MKHLNYFSIYLLILLGFSCTAVKPVSNEAEAQLSQQQMGGLLWYQQSAEMVAAYHQAYKYGEMLLDAKLDTVSREKPLAVVLDIDETILDNSPYQSQLVEAGKTYESSTWKIWTDEARAKVLPGALDFVNFARKNGVEVFYISNRKTDEINSTINNLRQHHFPNADTVHVLLRSTTSDKTERRESVGANHKILLFVGDNLTDYSEMFGNRDEKLGKDLVEENKTELLQNFVILPNPMYGEWEKAIYDNNLGMSTEEKLKKRMCALDK